MSEKKMRPKMWNSGDETIELLQSTMAPFASPRLFLKNDLYASQDMKVGIELPLLVAWAPMLEALLVLDPRGGFFAQRDIEGSIAGLAALEENLPHVEKLALEKKRTAAEFS